MARWRIPSPPLLTPVPPPPPTRLVTAVDVLLRDLELDLDPDLPPPPPPTLLEPLRLEVGGGLVWLTSAWEGVLVVMASTRRRAPSGLSERETGLSEMAHTLPIEGSLLELALLLPPMSLTASLIQGCSSWGGGRGEGRRERREEIVHNQSVSYRGWEDGRAEGDELIGNKAI